MLALVLLFPIFRVYDLLTILHYEQMLVNFGDELAQVQTDMLYLLSIMGYREPAKPS